MNLITTKLNNQLNELIGKSFSINRMLDRGMSLLLVRWGLINTSKILHQVLAHAYLGDKFADSISDYQGERNSESVYPATPIGNKEYNNVCAFFVDYLSEATEFEEMIKDAIDIANDEEDTASKIFLDGLMNRHAPYLSLAHDLLDIFERCENDKFKLIMLDSNIDKFINIQ